MMAREEDDGGRRKRVEARLDDSIRLFWSRIPNRAKLSKSDRRLVTRRGSLVTRPGYFLVVAAAPLPASNYQKAAWPGYEATQQR